MPDLIYPEREWDKKSLTRKLEWQFPMGLDRPVVKCDRYYLDVEGKRMPEYAATHIRVRVFHVYTGTPLDYAEEVVRRFAGLVELERLDKGRGDLRPQIIALIERKPKREI